MAMPLPAPEAARHATEATLEGLRASGVLAILRAKGSVDVAEWTCRLSTAAVTVAEAARRPTEDVFFDAAAVGPRAAAAVLLAAAHPSPDVHSAAAWIRKGRSLAGSLCIAAVEVTGPGRPRSPVPNKGRRCNALPVHLGVCVSLNKS